MLTMMLAAAATLAPPAVPVIGGNEDSNRLLLAQALKAPERPRRAGEAPRYCFADTFTDGAAGRRVCRSRSEWRSFGLDPILH